MKKKEKKLKTFEDKLNSRIKTKRVFLLVISICIFLLSSGMFVLYGPWNYVRETLISTAMTTMRHQYLATWFYSMDTINPILKKNNVIEPDGETNPDEIVIKDRFDYDKTNEYEKKLFDNLKDNELYRIIPVSGNNFKGYMVAVYDPSKVKIATTAYLGKRGESTKVMATKYDALVAINAGGFYDPDWNSNGAIPHGTVIQNGKVVWDYADAAVGGGFVGFDKDDKLILGRMSKEQALAKGIRDAIEFGPFLVVNGKAAFVKGNGGWGIAPRTAIGQRRDGVVLMLVIDGRRSHSVGADMVQLTELMVNFGAYNAANMDGGSSSSLIVNKKVYNTPVAGGSEGLRNLPTAWIVVE